MPHSLVLGLFALACAPRPAPSKPAAPRVHAEPTPLPSAPAAASAESPTPPPTPEPEVEHTDGGVGAPDAATGPKRRTRFHCFGWVHGPDHATDCFRSAAKCEKARLDMKKGARDVFPRCDVDEGAWCTRVGRGSGPKADERCFGSANDCARYEGYVQGNGLTTTGCVER